MSDHPENQDGWAYCDGEYIYWYTQSGLQQFSHVQEYFKVGGGQRQNAKSEVKVGSENFLWTTWTSWTSDMAKTRAPPITFLMDNLEFTFVSHLTRTLSVLLKGPGSLTSDPLR